MRSVHSLVTAALLLPAPVARAGELPGAISQHLPRGFVVMAVAHGRLTGGARDDFVVAVARPGDDPQALVDGRPAPARPLLFFRARPDGAYTLTGRNDDVVMRHDAGGQCDPFDPDQGLVMKGAYITVQNEVACGNHWSEYITFRFDKKQDALLFHSEIGHSWKLNPSDAPDAEALIPDGPASVHRADPRHPAAFSVWKPDWADKK